MKSLILVVAFLGGLSAAFADTYLNVNFQAADQHGNQVGTAKCFVFTSALDLSGEWTCAFNGNPVQTVKVSADYLAPATEAHAQQLDFTLASGDTLGDFIYKGLNLVGAQDSNALIITLGSIPSLDLPFIMVGVNHYSSYYYLNVSIEYTNPEN